MYRSVSSLAGLLLLATGCPTSVVVSQAASNSNFNVCNSPGVVCDGADAMPKPPQLSRDDFNRIAALLNIPMFWNQDERNPGSLDPDELVVLGFSPPLGFYVNNQSIFTNHFFDEYKKMIEVRRREAVAKELNQGRPTLITTNLSGALNSEKEMINQIVQASVVIEELYQLQKGTFPLRGCWPIDDTLSPALFSRNQGPFCEAPETEGDPFCNACAGFPKKGSGLYPQKLVSSPDLCNILSARPDSQALLDPFVVVRETKDGLVAVPYNKEWPEPMNRIAVHLEKAAEAFSKDEETAYRSYLLAAARAFETNEWEAADEAWALMNSHNSNWYLRVAPDEVYFEPCNRKAGFHLTFARIDPTSLEWQEKLTGLRQEMEQEIAKLIGPPYQARKVSFQMPDFIEIVINAGDDRKSQGATIGQSLPNTGKVAQEGRGRTVVMSNLYTDPDSLAVVRAQADSLLSPETQQNYCQDNRLQLLDIILHEATHNFGPHSDYRIKDKDPSEIFGGATATILEELKSQTGALYLIDFLKRKKLLDQSEANQVYNHAIVWCLGHISRGMMTSSGEPKPYSQVAAIHIAAFMKAGAMTWETEGLAANGKDSGRFTIHYEQLPGAVANLMQRVGRIKALPNQVEAQRLLDETIRGKDFTLIHSKEVTERILRFAKTSFVYSLVW